MADFPSVDEFRRALLTKPTEEIVTQYIFEGLPYVFRGTPGLMEVLRKHLCDDLGISPESAIVIGSAKTGFSLSPDTEEKRTFYGYRFAVRYLNTDSDDDVRDVFRRLNKFLTPLKPQELRNATYMGPFIRLAEKLADNEYWAENRVVTPASIRRMGDVEFVSELLIGVLHGPQGGSERIIDEYYIQYEDYEDEFPQQRRIHKLFEGTLASVQQLLPNIKETRWSNKTDFYTLFVSLASLLRTSELPKVNIAKLKKALVGFEREIDHRLGDERANVSKSAVEYVRAVEKGANDKKRRADRQEALLNVLRGFFKKKKAKGDKSSN